MNRHHGHAALRMVLLVVSAAAAVHGCAYLLGVHASQDRHSFSVTPLHVGSVWDQGALGSTLHAAHLVITQLVAHLWVRSIMKIIGRHATVYDWCAAVTGLPAHKFRELYPAECDYKVYEFVEAWTVLVEAVLLAWFVYKLCARAYRCVMHGEEPPTHIMVLRGGSFTATD